MKKLKTCPLLQALACPLLLVAPVITARAQAPDLLHRVELAAEETSIDAPDAHPWHLKLAVTLPPGSPGAGSGTIEQWWNGPSAYRIIYDLPTYKATVVRHGDVMLRTPGLNPPPFVARHILRQTVHPTPRTSDIASSVPELAQRTFGKLKLDCISLHKQPNAAPDVRAISSAFCLLPGATQLILTTDGSESQARTLSGTFRGKQVPLNLQIIINQALAMSSHIEQLQGQTEPYAEVAQTDGAGPQTSIFDVETPGLVPGKLVRHVNPLYPELAKRDHVSGEVALDVVIGVDGHVQSQTPVYAADPNLLAAAMDAVKQWTYTPCLLNGVPTATQTKVTVNFAISR
jgi:TonB family protein